MADMSRSNSVCWKSYYKFVSAPFDSIHSIRQLYSHNLEYGNFIIRLNAGKSKVSRYIGCDGSYVDYKGIRYEGEAGMYRLVDILEKEKIQNLLNRM